MTPVACLPRRVLSVILSCFVAAAPLLGAADPQQSQPTGGTFSAESNMVLVPVVVADGSGKHITGLQQSDFTIKDNGKEQKIVSFEEVKEAPAAKLLKPSEPGVFSNSINAGGAAHGVTIIVLDQVNTPFLDQSYARAELLKFLAGHINASEPTGLIMLGRKGVRVIHDFTTDTAVLLAALKKVSSRSDTLNPSDSTNMNLAPTGVSGAALNQLTGVDRGTAVFETSALDEFYNGTDGGYGAYQTEQAIEITLSALMHIAEAMEGIAGRKSVIWATGGFPFTLTEGGEIASLRYYSTGATRGELGGGTAGGVLGSSGNLPPLPESNNTTADDLFANLRPQVQRTMQALAKAQISIYPIDARGMVAFSSAASSRVRLGDVYGTEIQTHTTMNEIASVTGGKAYYNTNDITGAFMKATGESAQYYMIGYYAEKEKKVGWHKLKVTVARPGVDVRARSGYMSGVTPNPKKPEDFAKLEIHAAVVSPLDYTSLPIRVYFDPATAGTGNKKRVPFEIVAQPGAAAVDSANKNHVQLDFLVIARDSKGQPVGQVGQKIEANLQDSQLKQFSTEGLNYKQALQLPPGSYNLVFVVRDNLTGKIGSVNAPLLVQ